MRARRRKAKYIRCELHGGFALAAAASYPQLCDWDPAPPGGPFGAFFQRIGQPLQDCTVQMSTGMHISKANDRPFGFRAGHF